MRKTTVILILMLLFVSFGNCSKTRFSQASGGSSAQSCAYQLQTITAPVKTLFIVDMSGSNADDFYYYGSDNNKTLRGSAIQRYFDAYRARANFSWGFLTFSEYTASSLIGSSANPVFANSLQMQNAINIFYSIVDSGLTPYRAALNLARTAISSDTASTTSTKYIIVFLSDGLPDPEVSDSILHSDLLSIVNLKPGQVTFNAIYYGTPDNQASARLTAMASVGGGKFLDTNVTGATFDISNVVNVAGVRCTQ